MSSEDGIDSPTTAVEISELAHRTAILAAQQANMPLPNWIALAILGAAADQVGLAPISNASDQPDDIQNTLRRLETKLDQALTSRSDGGPTQRFG